MGEVIYDMSEEELLLRACECWHMAAEHMRARACEYWHMAAPEHLRARDFPAATRSVRMATLYQTRCEQLLTEENGGGDA